ncbi:zinc ion binding [Didymella keratinophila]|nr:zinc ion binding [Didymella keratinophila]
MTEQLPGSNTSLTYTTPSSPPHLTHTPISSPGPNEILVKIQAAAINPVDIQLWHNPLLGLLFGAKEKGIGRDYAGTIVALGSKLESSEQWQIGDRVFGLCNRPAGEGTFAQFLVIKPGEPIAKMPRTWTFEQAAAVPLVVLTAFACLSWLPTQSKTPNREERRAVVCGASGGVGMWVVQLAKNLFRCHVTAICSGRNEEFVSGLGADEVVDYTERDVAETLLASRPQGRKYDLYVDCVGGTKMFGHWYELLHKDAAYITIVGDKTSRTAMGGPLTYFTYPSQICRYVYGYFFGPRYANVLLYQKSELLEQVAKLADDQGVQVEVQDAVKGILSETEHDGAWKKVKRYMVEGRVRGKIVALIE